MKKPPKITIRPIWGVVNGNPVLFGYEVITKPP
jgi:hypothetical protein